MFDILGQLELFSVYDRTNKQKCNPNHLSQMENLLSPTTEIYKHSINWVQGSKNVGFGLLQSLSSVFIDVDSNLR